MENVAWPLCAACRRNPHRALQFVLQHIKALVCGLFGINGPSQMDAEGVDSCTRLLCVVLNIKVNIKLKIRGGVDALG
jgi:hypothetical protein